MADDLDARLRSIARAAAADVDSLVDVDADLATLDQQHRMASHAPGRSRRWVLLPAASLVVVAGTAALLLASRSDSTDLQVTSSTLPTVTAAPTPSTIEVAGTAPVATPTSTAPSTTVDEETVDTGDRSFDTAIPFRCVGDFNCTQLQNTPAGDLVAYDPSVDELTRWAGDAQRQVDVPVALTEPIGDTAPRFVAVGPDDVAYFTVGQAFGEQLDTLIAIPLAGPLAGQVVAEYDGLDGSGDSDLAPSSAGLVAVGCCGGDLTRPSPNPDTVFPWVDASGAELAADPDVDVVTVTIGDTGIELLERGTKAWNVVGSTGSVRGMPVVLTASDGLTVAVNYSFVSDRGSTVVVGLPGSDTAEVYTLRDEFTNTPLHLSPNGRILVEPDGFDDTTFRAVSVDSLWTVPTSTNEMFCKAFELLQGERPETYVGSQEHLDDIDALLAAAPSSLRPSLQTFRDFIASGAIDSTNDPDSNLIENWPIEVQAAITEIQRFGTDLC